MINKITTVIATVGTSVLVCLALILPASAQGSQFDLSGLNAAATGTQSYTTYKTGEAPSGMSAPPSNPTTQQNSPLQLNQACLAGLAPVFGMSGYGWGGGATGPYGGWGGPGPGGNLSGLASSLPNSTFAQNHPRRTEVLEGDSNLYNQINSDYGYLSGQYPNLANQALAIENQEQNYAAQNGGYITLSQQAQLNQEESTLGQQVAADHTTTPYIDSF